MTSFPRDANRVPVVGGVFSTDGTTPAPIEINESGELKTAPGVGTYTTKETRSTTSTTTSVADTASSTTILASNANRIGATIVNDSSAVFYLLLGSGTVSATNYTVRIAQYGYYEVPFNYTGQINGIWASDPNDGAARVTEIT